MHKSYFCIENNCHYVHMITCTCIVNFISTKVASITAVSFDLNGSLLDLVSLYFM